jgi:hypothetical protein
MDDDGWIPTSLVTDGHTQEPTVVPMLREQSGELKRFVSDGIYDRATVVWAVEAHRAATSVDVVVPPRRDAVPSNKVETAPTQRDHHIATIVACRLAMWRWASA